MTWRIAHPYQVWMDMETERMTKESLRRAVEFGEGAVTADDLAVAFQKAAMKADPFSEDAFKAGLAAVGALISKEIQHWDQVWAGELGAVRAAEVVRDITGVSS